MRAFTVPGGWLFSRHTSVKKLYLKIRRWVAELLLVFVGVYAAFWLNNFQQHQEQARQRDQIHASLEQELEVGIKNAKEQTAHSEQEVHGFQGALENGQQPKLSRFTFTTDYNPGDIATLLQAGGISLLEVKTLSTLREFESVVRWGLSRMAHYQKLSDELIAPNLGQDPSFFYEENGRHLRAQFDFYAEALQARRDFFNDLEQKEAQLLSQIKNERQSR
jgi:hypothetical protein